MALLALLLATFGHVAAAEADDMAPIGTYSTIRYTGEHCDGYMIDLWRTAGTIQGMFHACKGLIGDLPIGLIERSSYDEKSGRLTFQARLTLGTDYLGGGKEVPSRDLFTFDGRLSASELSGTLKSADQVYGNDGDNAAASERIRLRKERIALPSYPSLEEWRRQADESLKVYGPKW